MPEWLGQSENSGFSVSLGATALEESQKRKSRRSILESPDSMGLFLLARLNQKLPDADSGDRRRLIEPSLFDCPALFARSRRRPRH